MATPSIINFQGNLNTGPVLKQAQALGQKANAAFTSGLGSGGLPLGRIPGDFKKFEQSIDAATARVLAFTATTTLIYGMGAAFKRLTTDAIKIEAIMARIGAITGDTSSQLKEFQSNIFKLANATSTSFYEAAEAAEEFSRQGLGLVETLDATKAALAIAKLSGTSAKAAIEGLTATITTFGDKAGSYSEVAGKLLALDAKFATSAGGIIDGLKRVAGVAEQAGLSLDETASSITALKQVTGRSEAVLGNSLKSIIVSLQAPKVIAELQNIGVEVQDANGEFRDFVPVVKELSEAFDGLGDSQKAAITQKIAGKYQANAFQGLLTAFKGGGEFDKALNVSGKGTNEQLQKRLDAIFGTTEASLQRLSNKLTEFGSQIGSKLGQPIVDNFAKVFGGIFDILGKGFEEDGKGLGNSLVSGIVNVVNGPGLALLAVGFGKLLARLIKESGQAFKSIAGIGAAKQRNLEIDQFAAQVVQSLDAAERARIGSLTSIEARQKAITAEMVKQLGLATQGQSLNTLGFSASRLPRFSLNTPGTVSKIGAAVRRVSNRASGDLPERHALIREAIDIRNGVGGARPHARPRVETLNLGKGREKVVVNSDEKIVRNYGGGQDAVLNREMMGYAGGFLRKPLLNTRILGQKLLSKVGLADAPGSYIGATKFLLKHLSRENVPVYRDSDYTTSYSSQKGFININREEGKKTGISPIAALFHETGHGVDRDRLLANDTKNMESYKRQVRRGLPTKLIGGKMLPRSGVLKEEREANINAFKLIKQSKFGKHARNRFKSDLLKNSYAGYLKSEHLDPSRLKNVASGYIPNYARSNTKLRKLGYSITPGTQKALTSLFGALDPKAQAELNQVGKDARLKEAVANEAKRAEGYRKYRARQPSKNPRINFGINDIQPNSLGGNRTRITQLQLGNSKQRTQSSGGPPIIFNRRPSPKVISGRAPIQYTTPPITSTTAFSTVAPAKYAGNVGFGGFTAGPAASFAGPGQGNLNRRRNTSHPNYSGATIATLQGQGISNVRSVAPPSPPNSGLSAQSQAYLGNYQQRQSRKDAKIASRDASRAKYDRIGGKIAGAGFGASFIGGSIASRYTGENGEETSASRKISGVSNAIGIGALAASFGPVGLAIGVATAALGSFVAVMDEGPDRLNAYRKTLSDLGEKFKSDQANIQQYLENFDQLNGAIADGSTGAAEALTKLQAKLLNSFKDPNLKSKFLNAKTPEERGKLAIESEESSLRNLSGTAAQEKVEKLIDSKSSNYDSFFNLLGQVTGENYNAGKTKITDLEPISKDIVDNLDLKSLSASFKENISKYNTTQRNSIYDKLPTKSQGALDRIQEKFGPEDYRQVLDQIGFELKERLKNEQIATENSKKRAEEGKQNYKGFINQQVRGSSLSKFRQDLQGETNIALAESKLKSLEGTLTEVAFATSSYQIENAKLAQTLGEAKTGFFTDILNQVNDASGVLDSDKKDKFSQAIAGFSQTENFSKFIADLKGVIDVSELKKIEENGSKAVFELQKTREKAIEIAKVSQENFKNLIEQIKQSQRANLYGGANITSPITEALKVVKQGIDQSLSGKVVNKYNDPKRPGLGVTRDRFGKEIGPSASKRAKENARVINEQADSSRKILQGLEQSKSSGLLGLELDSDSPLKGLQDKYRDARRKEYQGASESVLADNQLELVLDRFNSFTSSIEQGAKKKYGTSPQEYKKGVRDDLINGNYEGAINKLEQSKGGFESQGKTEEAAKLQQLIDFLKLESEYKKSIPKAAEEAAKRFEPESQTDAFKKALTTLEGTQAKALADLDKIVASMTGGTIAGSGVLDPKAPKSLSSIFSNIVPQITKDAVQPTPKASQYPPFSSSDAFKPTVVPPIEKTKPADIKPNEIGAYLDKRFGKSATAYVPDDNKGNAANYLAGAKRGQAEGESRLATINEKIKKLDPFTFDPTKLSNEEIGQGAVDFGSTQKLYEKQAKRAQESIDFNKKVQNAINYRYGNSTKEAVEFADFQNKDRADTYHNKDDFKNTVKSQRDEFNTGAAQTKKDVADYQRKQKLEAEEFQKSEFKKYGIGKENSESNTRDDILKTEDLREFINSLKSLGQTFESKSSVDVGVKLSSEGLGTFLNTPEVIAGLSNAIFPGLKALVLEAVKSATGKNAVILPKT